MLYKFLHILFKLSQFVYFKKVKVDGNHKIKKNQASLIIANHSSAFMDPILAGINIKTPIYFLAAEEFMGGKKMSRFLAKNFNMIPIFRPSTRPDEIHKNTNSFDKCYQALKEGKSILIFAEGHSETQPWLDPLKSGTARIAIEALQKYKDLEQINIIPLGLNYSNPHQFRSTFFLKVGDAIELKQNHEFDKTNLTQQSYDYLRQAMNGVNQTEADWQQPLTQIVESINQNVDIDEQFKIKNKLINQLNVLQQSDSSEFETIKLSTLNFLNTLGKEKIKLSDFLTIKYQKKTSFINFALNFILFLPGFILNALPLYVMRLFVSKREFKYSFEGSMYFAFGTLFTFVWHFLIVGISFIYLQWWSFLLPFGFILFGLIALKSYDKIKLFLNINSLQKTVNISNDLEDEFQKLVKLLKFDK